MSYVEKVHTKTPTVRTLVRSLSAATSRRSSFPSGCSTTATC